MNPIVRNAALTGAILMLAGCATTRSGEEHVADTLPVVQDKLAGAVDTDTRLRPRVRQHAGIWLAPVRAEDRAAKLPAVFRARVTLLTDQPVDLRAAAQQISQAVGLAVRVSPDALAATQAKGQSGSSASEGFVFNHNGTLASLLDQVAARFGVSWRARDNGVEFFYLDTRTFAIRAIPGDSTLSASVIANGSGGGSSGGGTAMQSGNSGNASQSTEVNSKLSVWDSLKASLDSMISKDGKAVVSPAMGTVTVTDTGEGLQRVASYLEHINASLDRQVAIKVKVYSVTLKDGDQYGLDWQVAFQKLSGNYGLNLASAPFGLTNVGSLTGLITAPAGGSAMGQWNGSQMLVQALSTQGKVRLVTSAVVTTLNDQPVPVQVGTQTSYLASVSTTSTVNAGTATSLTPGVVNSGFNMNLLPHLLDRQDLMLQFAVNISQLQRIDTVQSGADSIQVPVVDTRNFLQRVRMRSGQTLVLSGFEQSNDQIDRQGTGDARNWLLGGGAKASQSRDVIVIEMTPQLVEN